MLCIHNNYIIEICTRGNFHLAFSFPFCSIANVIMNQIDNLQLVIISFISVWLEKFVHGDEGKEKKLMCAMFFSLFDQNTITALKHVPPTFLLKRFPSFP